MVATPIFVDNANTYKFNEVFMKRYKLASILVIIHGAFMEIGGCFAFISILIFGKDKFDIREYFSFIVPYLQENLHLMIIMGGIYGFIRL